MPLNPSVSPVASAVRPFGTHIRTDNPPPFPGNSESIPIDLSKVTKLEGVVFHLGSWSVKWVIGALRIVTPEHPNLQITIGVPYHLTPSTIGADAKQTVGEGSFGQWPELDRLLVQFRESRSIRSKVICMTLNEGTPGTKEFMECLLPVSAMMGILPTWIESAGLGCRLAPPARRRLVGLVRIVGNCGNLGLAVCNPAFRTRLTSGLGGPSDTNNTSAVTDLGLVTVNPSFVRLSVILSISILA